MNADVVHETFAQLKMEIQKSQDLLTRRQTRTNEHVGRLENCVVKAKNKFSEKVEKLKETAKIEEEDHENTVSSKIQLEQQIKTVANDLEYDRSVLDDRLRCLELKRQQLEALELVCKTTKLTSDDYALKNENVIQRLQSHIGKYEQNLDVKIRIMDDKPSGIRMFQTVFHLVSPSNNDECQCRIVLSYEKTNYEVVECRPVLNLDADMKQLNADGNLSNFLVALRCKFQRLVSEKNNN